MTKLEELEAAVLAAEAAAVAADVRAARADARAAYEAELKKTQKENSNV
jgi:hypothetical protein